VDKGWTFDDIGKCTDIELVVAITALRRMNLLNSPKPTGQQIQEDPNLAALLNAIMEEEDKLENYG